MFCFHLNTSLHFQIKFPDAVKTEKITCFIETNWVLEINGWLNSSWIRRSKKQISYKVSENATVFQGNLILPSNLTVLSK